MFRSLRRRLDPLTGLSQLWRRFAGPAAGSNGASQWLFELAAVGDQLGRGRISQDQWRQKLDDLYGRADLSVLLQQLDFPRISTELAARDATNRGDKFATVAIGAAEHSPVPKSREPSRVPISKISHIQRGRSIPLMDIAAWLLHFWSFPANFKFGTMTSWPKHRNIS